MSQFQLAACVPFDGQGGEGFHLPIFTCSFQVGAFVQICNESGSQVAKFGLLESVNEGLIGIDNGAMLDTGSEPIFVFVRDDGQLLWGTKGQIADSLNSVDLDHARSLQLAELVGSDLDKFAARAAALSAYGDSKMSAEFLLASVSAQAIWDNLISSIVTESAAIELRAFRRTLMLLSDAATPEVVPDEIWLEVSSLVSIDRSELRRRLSNELPNSIPGTNREIFDKDLHEPKYKDDLESKSIRLNRGGFPRG